MSTPRPSASPSPRPTSTRWSPIRPMRCAFAPDCTRVEVGLKTGFSGNHLRRSLNRGPQYRVIKSTTTPEFTVAGDEVRARFDLVTKPSLAGRRVGAHIDETFLIPAADGADPPHPGRHPPVRHAIGFTVWPGPPRPLKRKAGREPELQGCRHRHQVDVEGPDLDLQEDQRKHRRQVPAGHRGRDPDHHRPQIGRGPGQSRCCSCRRAGASSWSPRRAAGPTTRCGT